jgi:hypothetical protein
VWWRDREFKEDPDRGRTFLGWGATQEAVTFEPSCPRWAWEMAKQLTRDKGLSRRLGYVQKKQLHRYKKDTTKGIVTAKRWSDCDLDKIMPVHVRVKILKVAASNEIARELIIDDPEAAAVIIRDIWGSL